MEFGAKRFAMVSAAASVLGLILIYISASAIKPNEMKINEINFDHVGMSVTISGTVAYANTHPAGHIFLTVSDANSRIQVPIFSALANELRNSEDLPLPHKGSFVKITGIVGEYKGDLQVVPRKLGDIQIR